MSHAEYLMAVSGFSTAPEAAPARLPTRNDTANPCRFGAYACVNRVALTILSHDSRNISNSGKYIPLVSVRCTST